MPILLEACLDSAALARAAEEGGARRIELCERLDIGGTTPGVDLVREVVGAVRIPVYAIVRPRGGDFVYSTAELETMKRDAATMKGLGASGIVVGILDERRTIDRQRMREMIVAANGLPVSFHLAFEQVPDRDEALDTLIDLGVERVLTKGGGATALAGVAGLRALVDRSTGRIGIMAGGGVREQNIAEIIRRSGVREVHSRGLAIAEMLSRANAAFQAAVQS